MFQQHIAPSRAAGHSGHTAPTTKDNGSKAQALLYPCRYAQTATPKWRNTRALPHESQIRKIILPRRMWGLVGPVCMPVKMGFRSGSQTKQQRKFGARSSWPGLVGLGPSSQRLRNRSPPAAMSETRDDERRLAHRHSFLMMFGWRPFRALTKQGV